MILVSCYWSALRWTVYGCCIYTCCCPSESDIHPLGLKQLAKEFALAVAGANQSNHPAVTETSPGVAALRCPGRSRRGPRWERTPPSGSQEVRPHVYPLSLSVFHLWTYCITPPAEEQWWDASGWMSGTSRTPSKHAWMLNMNTRRWIQVVALDPTCYITLFIMLQKSPYNNY